MPSLSSDTETDTYTQAGIRRHIPSSHWHVKTQNTMELKCHRSVSTFPGQPLQDTQDQTRRRVSRISPCPTTHCAVNSAPRWAGFSSGVQWGGSPHAIGKEKSPFSRFPLWTGLQRQKAGAGSLELSVAFPRSQERPRG